MSPVRAFLAVPLTRQLQDSIGEVQKVLQAKIAGVRWVRPENLHMTLHFFGEITQETLEQIKVSVLSVKRCQRPFPVEVKGLGAFPTLRRPRIIWLGMEPKDQLRQLHGRCRELLRQAGVATESRPYSPHLTIGRLKQHEADLTVLCHAIGRTSIGEMPVDRLVLYESRLHPGGAEHIPLMTVNLDDKSADL